MLNVVAYFDEIRLLCKQSHVKELYIFGSAITKAFNNNSDVDLLVDFFQITPKEYAENYFRLKFSLEELLGCPVDLLEKKGLKNPYLSREIDAHKQLVYAA